MDLIDQLNGVLDLFESKKEEVSPSTMYQWATKSADAIILLTDKEAQKVAILKILEEAYVKGAEATINVKK